jgi:hypothetical protein
MDQKLRDLGHKLAGLYTPEEMMVWLFSAQKALGDNMPALIILRGQTDELLRLLTQIEEGAYI